MEDTAEAFLEHSIVDDTAVEDRMAHCTGSCGMDCTVAVVTARNEAVVGEDVDCNVSSSLHLVACLLAPEGGVSRSLPCLLQVPHPNRLCT